MIKSKHSGMVLDIKGNEHGANIIQWPPHGGDNQLWRWNGFSIVSKTGLALDVEGGGTDRGAEVLGWTHHGGDNQKWRIQGDKIISASNNMALDVEGESREAGAKIVCWPLKSEFRTDNQSWKLNYLY